MLNPNVWGKTLKIDDEEVTYPLAGHLLDSAGVISVLWRHWLKKEIREYLSAEFNGKALSALKLAAGLHDLGKCSPIFQGALLAKHPQRKRPDLAAVLEKDGFIFPYIEESQRSKKFHRHEKLGFFSLDSNLRSDSESAGAWLEISTVGHHGSFELSYKSGRQSQIPALTEIFDKRWRDEQAKLLTIIEQAAEMTVVEAHEIAASPLATILVSGLVVLADRIASSDESVYAGYGRLQSGALNINKPLEWLDFRSDEFYKIIRRELGIDFDVDTKEILGEYSPRGVQKIVPRDDELWLCMAPTGSGKTEAALLRHAQKSERLIFLLPTMATTNAMMARMTKVYAKGTKTATLGHGHAFLEDFYNQSKSFGLAEENDDCGLTPTKFSAFRGATLSSAVNIATIDQLLTGGLPLKWTQLRWILLLNSHIVIDEAHLVDRYQLRLLAPLLKLAGMLQTRVTILSATLPRWLQKELTAAYSGTELSSFRFPASLVTGDSVISDDTLIETEHYESKIELTESENLEEAHIEWAVRKLSAYPRARLGVFVNQVKRAQEIALELANFYKNDETVTVLCLHSRLLSGHRRHVTQNLLSQVGTRNGAAERFIIVGTQTIEMSLDIDLDFISTDLCPAPSLIQRMGRMWRDKNIDRSHRIATETTMTTHIVYAIKDDKPAHDNLLPYSPSVLNRTLDYLRSTPVLCLPDELQDFVETVYLAKDDDLSKDEVNEKSDELFKEMKGIDAAINVDFIINEAPFFPVEISDYASLTNSTASDEALTRFIEGQYTEPFVICSDNPVLQNYGALPTDSSLEKVAKNLALAATASASKAQIRTLLENGYERLNVSTYSYGFFGKVPEGLTYNELVGLL